MTAASFRGSEAAFITTKDARDAVAGREGEILSYLGIDWLRTLRGTQIECPHCHRPNHWRWNLKGKKGPLAHCSCYPKHSANVFGVLALCEGLPDDAAAFDVVKVRAMQILGREDLVRTRTGRSGQKTDPTSLLNPPAEKRDPAVPRQYLASRLDVPVTDVVMPSTPYAGWAELPYVEIVGTDSDDHPQFETIARPPCAVFGTIDALGIKHAHRIWTGPDGEGKAKLPKRPDGTPRTTKKSARVPPKAGLNPFGIGEYSTTGLATFWGDPAKAPWIILGEGIETMAAVAVAFRAEVEAGDIAVAAAISASGVAGFKIWPATTHVTVAADRDEAPKYEGAQPSFTGEKDARKFGFRNNGKIEIHLALPGERGELVDWLDIFRRDGVAAVRRGIEGADRYTPQDGDETGSGEAQHDTTSEEAEDVGAMQVARIHATPFVLRNPALIPRRQWLYGGHYIREYLSTTVAPGGVGKSSLIFTEALSMATGRDLIGHRPAAALKVWVWNGEDPRDELERRISAAAIHYKVTDQELAGQFFLDSGREMELVIATQARDGATIAEPVVKAVVETIRENKIDVFIVDPFVSSHRVTENDNNAIDRVAKTWGRIAGETGCAVELVHHVRKTAPGMDITMEDARGAGALLSAARSGRILNRMTPDEGARLNVENHKQFFRLGIGKANMAPASDDEDWFRLIGVDLGNGSFGMPGDSVGVVTAWTPPDPLADVTPDDVEKVKRTCWGKMWRADAQAAAWIGLPIARALRLDLGPKAKADRTKDQNAARNKAAKLVKVWTESGVFTRIDAEDEKRKRRPFLVVSGDDPADIGTS